MYFSKHLLKLLYIICFIKATCATDDEALMPALSQNCNMHSLGMSLQKWFT